MSKQSYKAKLPVLKAIPKEEVKRPNMPVDVFIQEAYNLHEWVQQDKKILTGVGLDWALVDDLPIRAEVLRYTQSIWMRERYSQKKAQEEWARASPVAYELKNDLEAGYRFAFRKHPELLRKVALIENGTGHSDMVQDLQDLAVLGKANTGLLQVIGISLDQLNEAETKSQEMSTLLARVNKAKNNGNPGRVMRDHAYTHTKAAVDDIRAAGRYAFRKDQKRLKGYRSEYHNR